MLPHIPYNDLIEKKPIESYTKAMRDEIDLLSINKDQLAIPFGSLVYRIQQYPGDLDLLETVEEKGTRKQIVKKVSKEIQKVVRKILSKPLHFFSEMKAGLDERYAIDIGKLENGIWHKSPNLIKVLREYYNKGLFEKKDYAMIQKGLKEPKDQDAYDVVNYVIREYRVLRWSETETLKGKKRVIGKTFSLEEAVDNSDTLLKIDEIALLADKFTEVTNVYFVGHQHKNDFYFITGPETDVVVELQKEIEKLYYSGLYYSPFKLVKRMFALCQSPEFHNSDVHKNVIYKLSNFVSSTTSMAYQIKSELSAMKVVIEKATKHDEREINNIINDHLDNIKFRLASFLSIDDEDLADTNKSIIQTIDKPLHKKKDYINILIDQLSEDINYSTIEFLDYVNLNPPPAFLLDRIPIKYDRSRFRYPTDSSFLNIEDFIRGKSVSQEQLRKEYEEVLKKIAEHQKAKGGDYLEGYNFI